MAPDRDPFGGALAALRVAAFRGAADAEEVCATTRRIADGDADGWVREWSATAGAAWAAGRAARAVGHRVSALVHYRRAGSYYAAALRAVAYGTEPERRLDVWRRQRACWDLAASLAAPRAERIAIPYEDTALPGYFFPAASRPGERRPLVVVCGDGPTSQAWAQGGAAAAERGYHWLTFDGPGQQAALYEQRLLMRPDWETVLGQVTDAMVSRRDVDPQRMAVLGTGDAGWLVTRAVAFEHRFAAVVADPGMLDLCTPWIAMLSNALREQLVRGDRVGFERDLHLAELFEPALTACLNDWGAPYRLHGNSRFELFETIRRYRFEGELERIATPLLVTVPHGDGPWAGQAEQLEAQLRGTSELLRLTDDDGEPLPRALHESRIFDWLDAQLAAAGSRATGR